MERLLEDVTDQGWMPEHREAFVRRYDHVIGETILDLMVEYGLLTSRRALRSLRSYIESRLRDQRADEEHPLWELVEEAYMRVYTEIFQKKLVQNYVNGVRAGKVQADFEGYLRGAVHRRFLDVLGAGELSEKELLDAIVDSKRPQTQRQHIAEAKGRFGERVRGYLLGVLSLEDQRSLCAITEYFFERFIPDEYAEVRARLKSGDSALLKLVEAFVHRYGRAPGAELTAYRGQIAPSLPRARRWAALRSDSDSESEGEEERLERAGAVVRAKDPAQGERLLWWDRLLRCRIAAAHELGELRRWLALLEGDAQRDTRLCLACVQLKAESTPEQQDDLRMFLVYYLSNYGTPPLAPPDLTPRSPSLKGRGSSPPSLGEGKGERSREGGQGGRSGEGEVTRETLSLEKIRGRVLSWEQIFTIFGRECNPTRVKQRIRERFESLTSPPAPRHGG
uniref:Uncharacterized protein n=1 Tax=Acetithermum autotrophicum TaxID=1446466 RepID=H5SSP5_ACEAU|nr:hypothetical protein HGMM_OP3C342 [Candidatus Acetothermum autotrophicum]